MENLSSITKVFKRPVISHDGLKFNKLTILRDCEPTQLISGKLQRRVLCKCDCGNEKEIRLSDIKNNKITSCGCVRLQKAAERATKHGMGRSRFYNIYCGMLNRCNNINNKYYNDYGGRGIKNEFTSFEHFRDTMLESYVDGLSLERIDVNGNYNPSNCTWIPLKQQARNRRDTVRYNGGTLIDYCESNGLSCQRVRSRINSGWDIEKAVKTPLMKNQFTYK